MKSKRTISLLLILCMLLFAIPVSAGAADTNDIEVKLIDAFHVPADAARAVVNGGPIPENYAASVAYVSDYEGIMAAVEDPAITIVVVLGDIYLEDTLVVDGSKLDLAFIALQDVTIYSADEARHVRVEEDFPEIPVDRTSKIIFSGVILDGNGTGGGIESIRGYDSVTDLLIDGLVLTNCNVSETGRNAAITGRRLDIIDSEIHSNIAGGVDAAYLSVKNTVIRNNAGSGIVSDSELRVTDSDISKNGKYGIVVENAYNANALVYVNNSILNENGRSGIRIDVNGLLTYVAEAGIRNTEISGNGTFENALQGGGIYVATQKGSGFGVTNCVLDGNTALDGGGIYVKRTQFWLDDCEIRNNTAENGAGVYYEALIEGSSNGTKIYNNTAVYVGGGVYFHNPLDSIWACWIDAEIYHNDAGVDGGGIYIDADMHVRVNGEVHNNTAFFRGGGIYIDRDSSADWTENSVYENAARLGADVWQD